MLLQQIPNLTGVSGIVSCVCTVAAIEVQGLLDLDILVGTSNAILARVFNLKEPVHTVLLNQSPFLDVYDQKRKLITRKMSIKVHCESITAISYTTLYHVSMELSNCYGSRRYIFFLQLATGWHPGWEGQPCGHRRSHTDGGVVIYV
jgi:hypothetical protein